MKKPHYDQDLYPMPDDSAVLTWNTSYDAGSFVFALNRLYNFKFERDKDLNVNLIGRHITCPCFTYTDSARQLFFVLIVNPKFAGGFGGQANYFDFILIINGRDAWDIQSSIFSDFTAPLPDPDPFDWDSIPRNDTLLRLRNQIIQTDYFDFRDPDNPNSSIYNNFPTQTANKISKYFTEISDTLMTILTAIGESQSDQQQDFPLPTPPFRRL